MCQSWNKMPNAGESHACTDTHTYMFFNYMWCPGIVNINKRSFVRYFSKRMFRWLIPPSKQTTNQEHRWIKKAKQSVSFVNTFCQKSKKFIQLRSVKRMKEKIVGRNRSHLILNRITLRIPKRETLNFAASKL